MALHVGDSVVVKSGILDPDFGIDISVSAISTTPCRRDNSHIFRSNIPGQERLVILQH